MTCERTGLDPVARVPSRVAAEQRCEVAGTEFPAWRVAAARVPYLLPPGLELENAMDQLARHSWDGEFVGPSGAGKSIVLEAVGRLLARRGLRSTTWASSLDAPEPTRREWATLRSLDVLLVDDIDTLRASTRRTLRHACRAHGVGLIATSKQRLGLGCSFTVRYPAGHAERVILGLFPDARTRPARATIDRLYRSHGGNLREVLTKLHERQLRIRNLNRAGREARPAGLGIAIALAPICPPAGGPVAREHAIREASDAPHDGPAGRAAANVSHAISARPS